MKRIFARTASVVTLSLIALGSGCATGKDKGSNPGGKRDSGRDTFSGTGSSQGSGKSSAAEN